MNISKNSVVSIHYTLKNDQGEILDTSLKDGKPLLYLQGFSNVITGLEDALEGKKVGDKLQVSIAPENAYGEYHEQMIYTVPKSELGNIDQVSVGMQFQVDAENGPIVLVATEVREEEVVLDGNHPLAGETLHFDVEVVEIRSATAEELAHGHVHQEGQHHH